MSPKLNTLIENSTERKQLLKRIIRIQAELDIRKALYDELDMLTVQLQAEGFISAEMDGLRIELIDNFASGNTVFRPAGVKHFEVKVKPLKVGGR